MQKYLDTTWRLWKLLRNFHKDFYLQLFYIIIQQIFSVSLIWSTAKILNNLVGSNFSLAYEFAALWATILIINNIVIFYSNKHQNREITNKIQQFLEEYSFVKVFNLNASQYVEDHSAIKLQVINRGEQAIENIISTIVFNLIPTITKIAFSLVAIAFYSLPIAFITAVSFLIVLFATNKSTNYQRPFLKKNIDNWDNQRKIRAESFQHLSLIKVSGIEESYLKKYLSNRLNIISHAVETFQIANRFGLFRTNFFAITRYSSVALTIYEFSKNNLKVGDVYAIWSWITDVYSNIINLSQAMRQVPLNFVELEKYLDVVDKEPEFKESGIKKFENSDIVFSDLSFKYPKADDSVIENLNITIPHGKKIAFVGFSGSGKSTIIKLLLRIYDWTSGDIKIGNKSLREIDAQALRQRIGYVEQHVDLFDTTIRENILFGVSNKSDLKKITDNKLSEIVYKARINEFFHRLGETGLDTVIGERGVKLSGGERQRIGIARALAKDPNILIFDEATASLDTENEKYIQEAIDESSVGRTTIIIAHRLSTVQNSDIIFVMDKGQIVGQGKHEFLKETCTEYQRLIYAQEN